MPTTTPTLPRHEPTPDTFASPSAAAAGTSPAAAGISPTAAGTSPSATRTGPFGLARRLYEAEVVRFLIIGAGNTLFSYILYVVFGAILTHLFPTLSQVFIADAALIISWPIAVTFSFLGFKHFVFKTQGNYLKEWLRCIAVYSVTVPASLVIVGVATKLLLLTAIPHDYAKYAAGLVNSATIASYSYFANKKYSFKK